MPRPPSPAPALLLALLMLAWVGRPASAYTPAEGKAPMTVTLVRSDAAGCGAGCPEWLALTGKIGFETPGRLAAALARLGKRRVPVVLDSPGGESLAGLAMGRMIRAHGLDTIVATTTLVPCGAADAPCRARERAGERDGHLGPNWGVVYTPVCASACVLALAGGVDRAVPSDAFVGVHQAKRVLTFHPVMNTFRVLSRIVNGRKVEVGRTLVATRALPVRVVTEAAPQSVYDQFERTLIGLGIDQSIVPLMRATPPSGIHWLTVAELASTRIGNDRAAAATLVERMSAVEALAGRPPGPPLAAALTLHDGRRWTGFVAWRVDAQAPGAPALVGDWEIPSRHLRGSLSIAPDPSPGATDAFRVQTRFSSGPGADAPSVTAVHPPQVCDPSSCLPFTAGPMAFGRPEAAFGIVRLWRTSFLDALYQRDWISTAVRTDEGEGTLVLTLSSQDEGMILDWEKACCDGFVPGVTRGLPAAGLPAISDHPEPSMVKGVRPIQPVAASARLPPRTLDMPALYDATPMQEHGFPTAVRSGSLTWFPLAARGSPEADGPSALLGSAELPAVGLRVSIDIGPSRAGIVGRLTARLHVLTDDPAMFGPLRSTFALHVFDGHGHPLLYADSVGKAVDGHATEVHLDIPETGPIAGAFQVGFADVRGRRVTLAFPFDPATAALLQAASRRGPASGS